MHHAQFKINQTCTLCILTKPEVDYVLLRAAVGLGVRVQQNVTVPSEEMTVYVYLCMCVYVYKYSQKKNGTDKNSGSELRKRI